MCVAKPVRSCICARALSVCGARTHLLACLVDCARSFALHGSQGTLRRQEQADPVAELHPGSRRHGCVGAMGAA